MIWTSDPAAMQALGEEARAAHPQAVTGFTIAFGDLALDVLAKEVRTVLLWLRDHGRFQQLVDIAGADYPQRPLRFDVVYHLLSLTRNLRVRIKVQTDEDTPVPSVISVYSNAEWFEREAFDLYGVVFGDHPDLRRILTDYGFQGHPLRKDFPLTGYTQVRWNDELKRVVYEPVALEQEWRTWDFESPWEGADYLLPGDEKGKDVPGWG
ncbi:MAG: NADH-quinone oxidoreductase subunit C [Proteobacteria bacterium]|nr:NADH-quinone oxidoreductase subunit C [Pseudomonadota bacterium]MBW3617584.1 NADH-quinone oxidoreductase subunit C [Pseudomonadota bacterium]